MKFWKIAYNIIGIIPWLFIISILAFYFHAGIILGHSPTYDNPDPQELSIYNFYTIPISITLIASIFALPAWIFFSIGFLLIKQRRLFVNQIILFSLGFIVGYLLLMSNIMEWYAD